MNGSLVTAQFLPISGSEIDLSTLTAVGDDIVDNVTVQTLDAYGRTVDSYTWNDYMYDYACWVDDNYEEIDNVTFAPGQGLFVLGSSSSQGIQSAGKVGTSDVLVQLRMNGTLAGNPFPVGINLQEIVAEGDDIVDNVTIQTLDAYGRTVDSYTWNDYMYDDPCWVDGNYEIVEGVNFGGGQGLFVLGSSSSQYLRFPAPEL